MKLVIDYSFWVKYLQRKMANRPKGYGMSADIYRKINAKYSVEDEQEVVSWICALVDVDAPPETGMKAVSAWMHNGEVLINLMNVIQPGSIKKWATNTTQPFKLMENISKFLKAIEDYGVMKQDLFQTVDLYEMQNMSQVLTTLRKLSTVALSKGFSGPHIGVKLAEKNVRNHDEQKLREGRNVIGLQMGTNQVASQKGMTAYGLGRQLTPQTK